MKDLIKKWWFWLIIVALVLCAIIGIIKYKEKKEIEAKFEAMAEGMIDYYEQVKSSESHLNEFTYNYGTGEVEYKPQANNTWLEKYNSIEKGMTSSEVIQILGEGFITPGIDDTEYFMNWGVNEGLIEGQIITIQFNNEKVHLKTQIGLK